MTAPRACAGAALRTPMGAEVGACRSARPVRGDEHPLCRRRGGRQAGQGAALAQIAWGIRRGETAEISGTSPPDEKRRRPSSVRAEQVARPRTASRLVGLSAGAARRTPRGRVGTEASRPVPRRHLEDHKGVASRVTRLAAATSEHVAVRATGPLLFCRPFLPLASALALLLASYSSPRRPIAPHAEPSVRQNPVKALRVALTAG